jgi:hypothetical protein
MLYAFGLDHASQSVSIHVPLHLHLVFVLNLFDNIVSRQSDGKESILAKGYTSNLGNWFIKFDSVTSPRTVMERTRAILADTKLPKELWTANASTFASRTALQQRHW